MTVPTADTADCGTWRVARPVRWRLWDGEAVAYDDRSGDTHHFADFAAWVFAQLCQNPASAAGLTRAAESAVELRSGEAPGAAVGRTLALLRRLRLIEEARQEPGR